MELVESKLRPPSTRPGIVPRTVLVERLLAEALALALRALGRLVPPGSPAPGAIQMFARRSTCTVTSDFASEVSETPT